MKSWLSLIPNLLTLSNLACGLIALLAIFNENYVLAAWLMVASLIFDFLDGMMARLLKVNSDLGVQLDSLADLVSFGLNPGFLMFHIIQDGSFLNDNYWLSYTALSIPLLSAWRLAVFNIDQRQTSHFIGLPTPANAIMIFAIALFPEYAFHPGIEAFLARPLVLSFISLATAVLLVAPLPLISLKVKSFSWQQNKARYILLLAILTSLLIFGMTAVVFVIPLYIVVSIIFKPSAE